MGGIKREEGKEKMKKKRRTRRRMKKGQNLVGVRRSWFYLVCDLFPYLNNTNKTEDKTTIFKMQNHDFRVV